MSITRRLAALITATGTVTAGLVSGATVTADAGAPGGGQTVEAVVKNDHTIAMPSKIKPGVTTFKVASRRTAAFQLFRPDKGYTRREFARDNNLAFGKNDLTALRRFEANLTLYGGTQSGAGKPGVMSANLPKGAYWAVDINPRRIQAADVKPFTVAGKSVGGTLPGTRIAAVDEHAWAKQPKSIPAHGRILFENRSSANHFIDLHRLQKGKTVKDFATWVKKGGKGAPPVNLSQGLDTGVISGGVSMGFPYRLAPGRYILSCFWQDVDEGGKPHVFLGMYRGLKVR